MSSEGREQNLNPEALNVLNVWVKKPRNIFHVALSALLYIITFTTFLAKADVIPLGLTGFVTVFIYLNKQLLLPYFSLIVALVNLPILLGFVKLLPRKLLILTGYWLLFQILFQKISQFTGLQRFLSNISLFNPEENRAWDVERREDRQTWPILLYGIIGGTLASSSVAYCWKFGGSSGGLDIIIAYFVYRYKKAIGHINTLVLFIALFFAFLISSAYKLRYSYLDVPKFLTKFLTTSIIILVSGQIFNTIFPKYSKVLLRFYSISRSEVILRKLEEIGYWHAYNKVDCSTKLRAKGVYIETVCLYLEVRSLVKLIRSVDPEVFIFIVPIEEVWGRFNTERIE